MSYVQIDVPDKIWSDFKKYVSRDIALAEGVIILIKNHNKTKRILHKENDTNLESKNSRKME